ncbi:hypothetical protein L227DRAFT_373385 [Lentinus tigrinus ALCF2SS1-6]|uniref:Uncharacterized protein n=1 Tax=Lentinus tigrinus ALCF2SS1-6 TaxID=1328759 RepID=A0A5C2RQW8_9APHY|nr:hypothetical protein L227DRAFT_373385 [Lentinus tigrinus ALCF2SS1-6]
MIRRFAMPLHGEISPYAVVIPSYTHSRRHSRSVPTNTGYCVRPNSLGRGLVQSGYAARTSVSWIWQRERQARSAQLHQDDCMGLHDRPPRNKFTSTLTQPYLDNGPVLNWPAANRMFPRRRRPAHIDSSMPVSHSCRGLRCADRF